MSRLTPGIRRKPSPANERQAKSGAVPTRKEVPAPSGRSETAPSAIRDAPEPLISRLGTDRIGSTPLAAAEASINRLPAYLQPKLRVSAAHDENEQQAERIANAFGQPDPHPPAQPVTQGVLPIADRIDRLPRNSEQQTEPDSQPIARAAAGDRAGKDAPEHVSARIAARKGVGMALPDPVKTEMEARFGHDFTQVRIHTDAEAAQLCDEVQALAFTVGADIYFASGQFAPDTDGGRKLLAHELTHTIQQGSAASSDIHRSKTATLARADSGSDGSESKPTVDEHRYEGPKGKLDKVAKTIHLPRVDLPEFKKDFTPKENVQVRKGREEGEKRETKQRSIWEAAARAKTGLKDKFDARLPPPGADSAQRNQAVPFGSGPDYIYYFRIGRSGNNYLVGTRANILTRLLRPLWTPEGRGKAYDVDHKHEYQLMGADSIDNLWLLDASANRSSGALIDKRIEKATKTLLKATKETALWKTPPELEDVRRDYQITIIAPTFTATVNGAPDTHYTLTDIAEQAKQLDSLQAMSQSDVRRAGIEGNDSRFIIFRNRTGGRTVRVDWKADENNEVAFSDENFIFGFKPRVVVMTPDEATVATIKGNLWPDNPVFVARGHPMEIPIRRMDGVPHAGALNIEETAARIAKIFNGKIKLKKLSPLVADSIGIEDDGNLLVMGRVLPTIPLFRDAEVLFTINGNEVSISKTFSSGELKAPPPFKVIDTSLTVLLSSSRGLAADGEVAFTIERIGDGLLTAGAETGVGSGGGFSLDGRFTFDEELFADPSHVEVSYRNDRLSANGVINVKEDSVAGIRSGSLTVTVNDSDFSVIGSVEPDIPGIKSANIEASRTDAEGLVFRGNLELEPNPAIRSGSVNASLRRTEEGWKVAATGRAEPAIPGVSSELLVSYDDGSFDASFSGAFERGMLSGQVRAGATNRNIGEDGLPTGAAEPGAPIIVYGEGRANLRISPWLQGSAGLRIDPSGEVTVSGEIGIPERLEIFRQIQYDKPIFGLTTQIPIIPGIVAEVGGNLSASASIGPGFFDQLRIGIEYNPAREEETRVAGNALFRIPAQASLRLGARAGIGLGITGASATGGLDIGGALGISGAAEANAEINWTPSQGLSLDTEASLSAQPAFRFDVSGYVAVTAIGFSLYDRKFELAAVELGSGLGFGLHFPIRYRENEPFSISLNDLRFEIPDVNAVDLVRQLGQRIF